MSFHCSLALLRLICARNVNVCFPLPNSFEITICFFPLNESHYFSSLCFCLLRKISSIGCSEAADRTYSKIPRRLRQMQNRYFSRYLPFLCIHRLKLPRNLSVLISGTLSLFIGYVVIQIHTRKSIKLTSFNK